MGAARVRVRDDFACSIRGKGSLSDFGVIGSSSRKAIYGREMALGGDAAERAQNTPMDTVDSPEPDSAMARVRVCPQTGGSGGQA
ncbi:hypothetical protein GCM10020369_23830 [Cryptosporangium minutisporangium]|uniref:Uncharacterized protein n=1 Tax=Cryptosporangium minutisporangium TaxID=113569 RepID=A0ABP6SW87_9ACTN